MKILVTVFLIYVNNALCATIPPFIHLCKRHDPQLAQCFIKTLNELRPYLFKGIPEMNIPPGEPLYYFNATGKSGVGTAVTLEASAWNQSISGLIDFDVKHLVVDLDNAKFSFVMGFPKLRLRGHYKMTGKILLFALDTIGKFDINTTNMVANAKWYGKFYEKKGKQHIEFEKIDLKLKADKIEVYMDNLINGNEEITRSLNQAINNNIELITAELDPIIAQIFGGIAQEYFNIVFRLFSVDELFPNV